MPGFSVYLEGACKDQRRKSAWNHFAQCYKTSALATRNTLLVCICELTLILIEPSYSCIMKPKPHDIGATKNHCKESNGTYAQTVF